jgi:NAD(P)-dependent dehydrogenase (short-subunit alcohol dehydrogenase family)
LIADIHNLGCLQMTSSTSRSRASIQNEFAGRVAVITGGGRGIGKATSIEMANQGAAVVITDVDDRAAKATAKAIVAGGGLAIAAKVDVSLEADVASLRDLILHEFRRLDILVNNAGVPTHGSVVQCTPLEWDRVIATNLRGSYLCAHFLVPLLSRNDQSSIVNVGSVQSLIGVKGAAAYVASKFGLLGLTKAMAADHAPRIRVNAVLPGSINTPLFRDSLADLGDFATLAKQSREKHLLKRIGQAREVADAIVFLASRKAAFITGAGLLVDGGLTAAL